MLKRTWPGWLLFVSLLSATAGRAQDVFLGGSLDVELSTGPATTFDFGREAGITLVFETTETTIRYQFQVAGGGARIAEFYALVPQARPVWLAIGRFLVPFGSPDMELLDKYVAGAPDLFDHFAAYRSGNIFLDTFGDGAWASWESRSWRADVAGALDPGSDRWNLFARVGRHLQEAEVGLSCFSGKTRTDLPARALALDASWSGGWGEVRAEPLMGRLAGADYVALFGEVRAYWDRRWEAGLKAGVYHPERSSATSTWKWRARRYDNPSTFWELRYELNDAPGEAGDDHLIVRYQVSF